MTPTVLFDQVTRADPTACHAWGAAGWGWHLLPWGLLIAVVAVVVALALRGPAAPGRGQARALREERDTVGEVPAEGYRQPREGSR